MSEKLMGWRRWFDRVIIGFLWGNAGVNRGVTLASLRLSDLLLAALAVAVIVVQLQVRPITAWPYKVLGALNLVALVFCIYGFKSHPRRALWRTICFAALYSLIFFALVKCME